MSGSAASIPLDVMGGGGPSSPQAPTGGAGFLGQAGQLIDLQSRALQMQNLRNQQQQFQATYGARQRAGQIIAGAPDLETGLAQASQDPNVAAFGGETLGAFRQMQQTLTATQGMKQQQNNSTLEAAIKATAGAVADPTRFVPLLKAQLATVPPERRAETAESLEDYRRAMTDNLPSDPAAAKAKFQQNAVGILGGLGISADTLKGVLPQNDEVQQGNQVNLGVRQPALLGGGRTSVGALGEGTPAGYRAPGEVAVGGVGAGGTTTGIGGGSPNPLGIGGGSPNPLALPPSNGRATAGGASPPSLGPDGSMPSINDLLGAIAPSALSPSARAPLGTGGVPILSKEEQQQSSRLADDFAGPELKAFQSAQQIQGSVGYMGAALDAAAKQGGLQTPGTLGEFRNNVAKAVNTTAQIFGGKPPFDPSSVASVEDLNKETQRMAFQVTNQYLGSQREAAETINKSLASVPSIDNTYLGSKLVLDGISAASQRQIDLYNFKNAWSQDPRNRGNLAGADAAFNKANPASRYTSQVLGKYGMDQNGFTSPEAVGKAYNQGYLTATQAKSILTGQFKDKFGPAPQAQGQGQ